jgi:predicted molibdopterin-dependent oxidoreductase YjgC
MTRQMNARIPGMLGMNAHGARRLAKPAGNAVQITFDGVPVSAQETDSVASALLAAGYRTFTIDPHDGSSRGGFCFVGRCSDCLMVIDGQPGAMACITPVREGMRVETQQGRGHWGDEGEA